MGYFDYPFDRASVAPFGAALEEKGERADANAPVSVRAAIDATGAVTGCSLIAAPAGDATRAGEVLCAAVRQGRLRIPQWYQATMKPGHVDLILATSQGVVPIKPVVLAPDSEGAPGTSAGAVPAGTVPAGAAMVSAGILVFRDDCFVGRPAMADADSEAVCAAFRAAGMPGAETTSFGKLAHVRLAVDPAVRPWLAYTRLALADRGQAVAFGAAPDPGPDSGMTMLAPADGRLVANVSPMDYPPLAMRHEIEGAVRVLIGYDRTGFARTCRPISSSNSTYLAFATCGTLTAKTRFEFVLTTPAFEGLRYRVVPMRWVIPRD